MGLGGPRRYGQAPGDGAVGQSCCDQVRHLELALGEPWPRVRGFVQETDRRLKHPFPVAVVVQVAGSRQRDQRRPRDERGDLAPKFEPGTFVPLAVQDRRPRQDRRQQRPDVGVVVDLQEPGGHGGRSTRPLEPGEPGQVLSRGIGDERPGQRLQPEAPVRPHQRDDRLPDLGGRQVRAAGAHPVHHERLGPVRVPRRDRRRELPALRGTEQAEAPGTHRVGHRQCRGHLAVERQVDPVALGQAAPGLVVPDHGEPLSQAREEGAEGEQFQLPVEMGDPAGIAQQRRPRARCRVSDTARGRVAVPDPRPHPSRLAPAADGVKE